MEEKNQDIAVLFERYYDQTATPVELQRLMELIEQSVSDEELAALIKKAWDAHPHEQSFFSSDESHRILQNILAHTTESASVVPISRSRAWLVAAASIVLVAGIGIFLAFFARSRHQQAIAATAHSAQDVKAPALNRATLTLSNGQNIYLDSTSNGTLANENDVQLTKSDDGKIVYDQVTDESKLASRSTEPAFNTLTNPRGSKVIDIILSDGTHIWLNAGSTLTYPVLFMDKERKVSISGEAYFEVKHDVTRPFSVRNETKNIEIQVLGTHFNVNTYDDEPDARVTLLEGFVKVVRSGTSDMQFIKPGQQIVSAPGVPLTVHNAADVDEVMAWKNNLFVFNGDKIQAVMRQVARWYDVDVQYKGPITNDDCVGYVSRAENVSQVLKIMETSRKVKFQIEGKTIVVTSP